MYIYHYTGICLTCAESWDLTNELWLAHSLDVMDHDSEQVFKCGFTRDTSAALCRVRRAATTHSFVFIACCVNASDFEQVASC